MVSSSSNSATTSLRFSRRTSSRRTLNSTSRQDDASNKTTTQSSLPLDELSSVLPHHNVSLDDEQHVTQSQTEHKQHVEQDEDDAAAIVNAAFVLQCIECRRIVCDSNALISSDAESAILTFASISPDVQIEANVVQVSSNSYDFGSTYYNVLCVCGKQLGQQHITTRAQHDHLRDRFTLFETALQSYVFGSSMPIAGQALEMYSLKHMFERCDQITQVCCSLNDRLSALENSMPNDTTNLSMSEEGASPE